MLSFTISGSYTDLYEIAMAETYFCEGRKDDTACFDYFFRKVPGNGGYVVFAGLQDLLDILADLHFTGEDLAFLQELHFDAVFIDYLKDFRFRGAVYACREGEIVFPNCPVLRVEGNITEAQLMETLLLNILNFESLVATKASRMKQVAGNSRLSDFGLRRAQGPGGVLATKAAVIGGFTSTSNVYAARLYGLQAVGTMAHSFIESYDNELDAFRAFAATRPKDCIFLADTYDTLHSGVPNAIIVAKEMEQRGQRAKGIRLDSGDLAYLSKAARQMFDEAGLPYMQIVASNQLDEYVIRSLKEQGALIDMFGVGTRLVTGQPDAALDGVYKLSMASGKPRLKLSETMEKTTLPGIKQVYRVIDKQGLFYGADAIALEGEARTTEMHHPFEPGQSMAIGQFAHEPLLHPVMLQGNAVHPPQPLQDIAAYVQQQLARLPQEYKHFENPHVYKVGVSAELLHLRDTLRGHYTYKP